MFGLNRTAVRDLAHCPSCDASRGERCRGAKRQDGTHRQRTSCHRERWEEASRARAHASISICYDPSLNYNLELVFANCVSEN